MTDRLKQAIEHAEKAGELYGLNILGNTLGIIEEAVEECGEGASAYEDLCEMWNDIGNDILRDDMHGCEGHMNKCDCEVLQAESKALAEIVTEECDTLDEIREALKVKE